MDSRLINIACFLSFSSWFFLGFSQNLGEQSNHSVGNPGEMRNVSRGLEESLGNTEGLGDAAVSSSSGAMSCIQSLLPCKSYLKSSSPPSSCCDPLKEMVSKDSQCLCSVLNNPEILKSFNITQDEALNFPKACSVDVDISKCKADSPDSSSTKPSSPSSPSSDSSSNNTSSSNSGVANLNHPINYLYIVSLLSFWFLFSCHFIVV